MSVQGWRATRLAVVLGALVAVLAFPSAGSSRAMLTIHVYDDFFDPNDQTFDFLDIDNPNIEWDWGAFNGDTTSAYHNVQQVKEMFKSGGSPKNTGKYELEASGGSYKYLCTVHQGMKAIVRIRPALEMPTPDTLKLTWANEFTETGKRFDVRYRIDGGKWKYWLKATRKTRATFGKSGKPVTVDTDSHRYDFEARTYKGKPAQKRRSGWSPPANTNA